MDKVLSWLSNNYELVIQIVCSLITLLLLIFRKNKLVNKVVNSPLHVVLSELPCFIRSAESNPDLKDGVSKKSYVLTLALSRLSVLLGESFDPKEYIDYLSEAIEDILKTPQKKGE